MALWCLGRQLLGLLVQELERVLLVNLLAFGRGCLMLAPLPQLASADFGRCSVFHQEVDGHTADSSEPALHVTQSDVEVLSDAVFGDLARHVHVEQIVLLDVDIFSAHVQLVGCRHVLVEDFGRNAGKSWVGNPGTVMTGLDLTQLVCTHTSHGLVVGLFVVLDGDLGSHTTLRGWVSV